MFYTGKGDAGSSQVGKKKYPKDSLILETLGELDELNSLVGLVKSTLKKKELRDKLQAVQENLFIVQATVARVMDSRFQAPIITGTKIRDMEREIESIENLLKPDRGFVISGSNTISSSFDYVRAVARRIERKVYGLHKKYPLPQEVLAYLNRLSSYFYALARKQIGKGVKESRPSYH